MSRIDALLEAMTLPEKLGQLTMTASSYAVTGPVIAGDSTESIRNGTLGNLLNMVGAAHVHEMQRLAVEHSRLKIPLLIGLDVIHGHRTLFPVPLAEAGTFDPELWWRTAREAALEAAADGLAMTFAPMLDVSRDPRWGRGVEGPGEDGWLATRIAEAKVKGFQGGDGSSLASAGSLAAVAKHYCAYGPVTAGREYAAVDISERALREVYLPAFDAAVAAGVAAVMPAFTDLAGIPLTAHVELLQGHLRGRLGFEGVIVSDYNAIGELVRHGIAADLTEAAALALKAGVDIDMMAEAYRRGLPVALERGLVRLEEIDAAVVRVLTLKERLGLFDDPYRRGATPDPPDALTRRRRLARDVAMRAVVMLKNAADTLPLPADVKRLALVGPLADAPAEMRGPWWAAGEARDHVSVLAGLRRALGETRVLHAPGVDIEGTGTQGIAVALDAVRQADATVLCVGEAAVMSGEAASRAHLGLPGQQQALVEAVCECARSLGRPVVAVLFSGRPLVVPALIERADAVLAAWFLGCEAGNALADLLTGRASPSGRTAISWPRAAGQIPIFFGERPSGRPANPQDHFTSKYLDVANEPQFVFGHGLTYGRFALANLRVAPARAREADVIEVQVDVTNTGARAAEETVFVFTHDVVASVTRPLLELRAFAKAPLRPGESTTLTLHVLAAALAVLGIDLRPRFEPGEIEVLVGPCADRAQLMMSRIELVAG